MTEDTIRELLDQAAELITEDTLPTPLDWQAIAVACHENTTDLEPEQAASLGFVAGYLAATHQPAAV